MDRWNGRVALVTGASVGIGAAICRELVRHGMTVIGCARSVEKIQAIAQEDSVKNSKGKLVAIKCDLNKESDILSVFEEIRRTYGRLDVCVNNAGLNHDTPLLSGNTADWQNILNVNVLALCICTREAVKLMREKGINDGQIIHISSIGGHRMPQGAFHGFHFYCGTKFMVRALTEGLRQELVATDTQIRVASISPGMVKTEFFTNFSKSNPGSNIKKHVENMPALTPDDIADSVVHILSAPPHVAVHDLIVMPTKTKV